MLHLSHTHLRPEAANAAVAGPGAAHGQALTSLLSGGEASDASDGSSEQQQQQAWSRHSIENLPTSAGVVASSTVVRIEELAPLLQVASAVQHLLEADVLLLQQLAGTYASLLQQTFGRIEQRLAIISLNPYIGGAPVRYRKEVFCGFTANP